MVHKIGPSKSGGARQLFKLTFDSSIIERTFQRDFFETYINQGVAGSFCGKEKGAAMLEELGADYDFNKADDAIAFVERITAHLERDMRTAQQGKMSIASQCPHRSRTNASVIQAGAVLSR